MLSWHLAARATRSQSRLLFNAGNPDNSESDSESAVEDDKSTGIVEILDE